MKLYRHQVRTRNALRDNLQAAASESVSDALSSFDSDEALMLAQFWGSQVFTELPGSPPEDDGHSSSAPQILACETAQPKALPTKQADRHGSHIAFPEEAEPNSKPVTKSQVMQILRSIDFIQGVQSDIIRPPLQPRSLLQAA